MCLAGYHSSCGGEIPHWPKRIDIQPTVIQLHTHDNDWCIIHRGIRGMLFTSHTCICFTYLHMFLWCADAVVPLTLPALRAQDNIYHGSYSLVFLHNVLWTCLACLHVPHVCDLPFMCLSGFQQVIISHHSVDDIANCDTECTYVIGVIELHSAFDHFLPLSTHSAWLWPWIGSWHCSS